MDNNQFTEFFASDRKDNQLSMTWKGMDVINYADAREMFAFLQQRDLDDRYSSASEYQFVKQNAIKMIKFLRAIIPGLGLKDAKDKVDTYMFKLLCKDDPKIIELERKRQDILRAQQSLEHAVKSASPEVREKWQKHQQVVSAEEEASKEQKR